jgi:hypothetical protein
MQCDVHVLNCVAGMLRMAWAAEQQRRLLKSSLGVLEVGRGAARDGRLARCSCRCRSRASR